MDDAKNFKTDAIREENPAIQDRTILAAFADTASAEQAKKALEIAGYKHIELTTGDPSDAAKPVHEHGFWDRLKSMFGGHRDAPVYAEVIRGGNTLVTVHTEQGRSAYAIDILDGFGPIEIKGGEQAWIGEQPDDSIRGATGTEVEPTTVPVTADAEPVVYEELLIIESVPEEGNDRVRSYSRNLPKVVASQDRGQLATDKDEAVADAVKRAD